MGGLGKGKKIRGKKKVGFRWEKFGAWVLGGCDEAETATTTLGIQEKERERGSELTQIR